MGVEDPAPFTADDYAARMARAASAARQAGLAGVLVGPGPDLAWLTGYQPTAITERLTLLVFAEGRDPTLLVPTLERPDALAAPGAPALRTADWTDGDDSYAAAARLGSDTTRTVHVGPDPGEEVRTVHEVVRRAQQAAFEAVRPGVSCQDIDRVARGVITDAGYGPYFIHRTGHGIGVTTHEPPYIVEGEEQPLVPGMCFSIEPGVYLPGRFGVRIEDIVTVTREGGRRLNTTAHELRAVA